VEGQNSKISHGCSYGFFKPDLELDFRGEGNRGVVILHAIHKAQGRIHSLCSNDSLACQAKKCDVLSRLVLFALRSLLENPLSLRRQTNVSLSLAVAEKMDRFAKIFHRGEFAPVARVLIEEALRHVSTESEYLEALKRSAVDEEGRPSALLEATHGKPTRRK
jgi:hypothetical protein